MATAVKRNWRSHARPINPVERAQQVVETGIRDPQRVITFRISLARNMLGVDTMPTESAVTSFATHLLAECEQASFFEKKTPGPRPEAPKLKALEGTEEEGRRPKEKGKGSEEEKGDEDRRKKCKFYLSDGGCRKGKSCTWSHDQKDEKRRCWNCGSVDHMQPAAEPVATPAQQLKVFKIQKVMKGESHKLLDSGATHPLRPMRQEERDGEYPMIEVTLADGAVTRMKMSSGGAMLTEDDKLEPIVPMGLLTQKFNCTVAWKKEGLEVIHPTKGKLEVTEINGCPQVSRRLALELIGEIEERIKMSKQNQEDVRKK